MVTEIRIKPKPFIRWAGGKRWLTSRIDTLLPESFNNYHEIFLGGAAVFFHANPRNQSFLNDLNPELINAFIQIKDNYQELSEILDTLAINKDNYYVLRETTSQNPVYNAARFIYLNKTCYNGIYRVNSKGKFNVPYGHNEKVLLYDLQNLQAVSKSLNRTVLTSQDFELCLGKIEKEDFVFIDPPYTVAHNQNGFIEYNQKIFSWEDQIRLADFINELEKKGAYYILTNAAHESIADLYKHLGKKILMDRQSTISGLIKNRKIISEYIVTNCVK